MAYRKIVVAVVGLRFRHYHRLYTRRGDDVVSLVATGMIAHWTTARLMDSIDDPMGSAPSARRHAPRFRRRVGFITVSKHIDEVETFVARVQKKPISSTYPGPALTAPALFEMWFAQVWVSTGAV